MQSMCGEIEDFKADQGNTWPLKDGKLHIMSFV